MPEGSFTCEDVGALAGEKAEELEICPAQQEEGEEQWQWRAEVGGARAEIIVDSAADESVCPQDWAWQFGTGPSRKHLKLVNANGGSITHFGSRQVAFQPDETAGRVLGVGFEVTDVKKPLLSVKRVCEKGNTVHFGPGAEDNYIQNVASGERIRLHRKGNSYVMRGALLSHNPL